MSLTGIDAGSKRWSMTGEMLSLYRILIAKSCHQYTSQAEETKSESRAPFIQSGSFSGCISACEAGPKSPLREAHNSRTYSPFPVLSGQNPCPQRTCCCSRKQCFPPGNDGRMCGAISTIDTHLLGFAALNLQWVYGFADILTSKVIIV